MNSKKIESRHANLSVFHKKNLSEGSITNTQRRIFGLLHSEEVPKGIGFYGKLAYRAHGGLDWANRSAGQMEKNLKSQMYGGRALEVMLCEALIDSNQAFHFLPPRELDMSYKMDLCSRIPYRNSENILHTFCIGTQITIAPLPGNIHYDRHQVDGTASDRYIEKYKQMQAISPYLHNTVTRAEIKTTFGKLSLPDIIAYVAINGDIGKIFSNNSDYTYSKFHEWKRTGFAHDQLSGHFKPKIREGLKNIASFIDWTQGYIISAAFHEKTGGDFAHEYPNDQNGFAKQVSFEQTSGELSFDLQDGSSGESLARAVYFLTREDIAKLSKKVRYIS